MKRKIYIKNWLALKPYLKQVKTDSYYLALCNKLYSFLGGADFFILRFHLDDEDIKGLCCFLVSYFEDIISGTKLFQSFTKKHEALYGSRLPFFDTTDYYPDEINEADVAFLSWYYLNTVQHERFVSPVNDFILDISKTVMPVFDEEYEFAPENEHIKQFYKLPEDADYYAVRQLMDRILLESYLFSIDISYRFLDEVEEISQSGEMPPHLMPAILNELRDEFVNNSYTRLLNMKGKEWAALLCGDKHPLQQDILGISDRISSHFFYKGQDDHDIFLEHIATGKKFNMTKESFDHSDELRAIDIIITIGLVKWKDEWWFSGIFSCKDYDADMVLNERNSARSRQQVGFLDKDREKVKQILQDKYQRFLEFNQNSPIAFLNSSEINSFLKKYIEFYNKSLNLSEKEIDDAQKRSRGEGFFGSELSSEFDFSDFEDDALVFFNPESGPEIGFGICGAFPAEINPFFKGKDSNEDVQFLLMSSDFSKELAMYCIDNYGEKLDFFKELPWKQYLENIDFLLRFWKKGNYHAKPEYTPI